MNNIQYLKNSIEKCRSTTASLVFEYSFFNIYSIPIVIGAKLGILYFTQSSTNITFSKYSQISVNTRSYSLENVVHILFHL